VHLAFDIFQGIGIAAAVGIRPFLPGLVVGALAAGDVEIHFKHTSYSFLQGPPFLLALVICAIVLAVLERRLGAEQMQTGVTALVLAAAGVVVGALLFAGSLCRGGYVVWPGFVGGVICALIGVAASRPFLTRLRARLDQAAAAVGVPLVAEGSAVALAFLSVVAPPVGPIGLVALLWLLLRGRGRDDQKYAGLRILR
jgi:Domain of unknown function (DUF4126)